MIIFLYGDDPFRSRRKLFEIKNKFLFSDKSGSGLSVFDCGESASSALKDRAKSIINALSTANLLAPKRLVIIKDLILAGPADEQKKMLDFLKKEKSLPEDKDTVAVFWESARPKKADALFKFFYKHAKSQEFEKLTGAKLNQWILRCLQEIDPAAKISGKALEKLVLFCENDSFSLYSQLQKLANYASGRMIGENDVDLLVKANLDGNIFAMVDALGRNDKKEALGLLHAHLEKGDDPFYLLSMFFYQFRNMLKVMDLYENGVRSEYEISKIAKLHPFVVRKSLAQSSRFPFSILKKIYGRLAALDTAVKTGKIEIKLALDKFVAEL